jgi:hypothetical protein
LVGTIATINSLEILAILLARFISSKKFLRPSVALTVDISTNPLKV